MAKVELKDTSTIAQCTEVEKIDKYDVPKGKAQGAKRNVINKLSETFHSRVNKPLIPLKLAVFCWFGAGALVTPFLALFLKQRGLPLEQLSFIYMVLPVLQFMGPTISGLIADKIGRSKPVLQANVFLTIVSTTCMILVPQAHHCNQELIQCHTKGTNITTVLRYCDFKGNDLEKFTCSFECPLDTKPPLEDSCFQNYIASCDPLLKNGIVHNLTWPEYDFRTNKYASCVMNLTEDNSTTPAEVWCNGHRINDCNSTCEIKINSTETEASCNEDDDKTGKQRFLIVFILLAAFHTFYSNCYRIIDVTSMSMIKTHHSDFGSVRFWSILGILVFSPLGGYVIDLATPDGEQRRYETVFYFFDAMAVVSMIVIWKLDVKTEPPSKGFLKKTVGLLKNPDVLVFFAAVLVIGTAWGFTKLYSNWYLEGLGATSSLIGLVPAVNSIIGLPFLLTSAWFVEKIGSTKLLLVAMLGYAAWCIGYSFLVNPWYCLLYEIFGITNYHLLWVAVVTHSHFVAPIGFAATVISAAGGIHYGVGKGSGSVIGGYVMSKYGGIVAYRVMATVCIGSAIFYALYLYIRRRFTKREMDLEQLEKDAATDYGLEEKFTPQIWY